MIIQNVIDRLRSLVTRLEQTPPTIVPLRSVPTLPQDAGLCGRNERRMELRRRREQYRYNYTFIPGLAMVENVPLREYPGQEWFLLAVGQARKVVANLLELLGTVQRAALIEGTATTESTAAVESYRARLVELENAYEGHLRRNAFMEAVRSSREATARIAMSAMFAPDGCQTPDAAVFGRGSGLWRRELENAITSRTCGLGLYLEGLVERTVTYATGMAAAPWRISDDIRADLEALAALLRDMIEEFLGPRDVFGRPESIEDYNDQFRAIPLPEAAKRGCPGYFDDDRTFALWQVAGQNPMMLTLVRDLGAFLERMPITNAQYEAVMKGDTLAHAFAEERLFYVDYEFSKNVVQGSNVPESAGQKYIGAPIGLFALTPQERELTAVAIQCQQQPGPQNPVITPTSAGVDGDYSWAIAKAVFNNATGNNSEFVQHLGYAHLLVEGFGLAMVRTLPSEHPLNVLLTPHIEGTMFANDLAQSGMNNGNLIAAEISATIPDTLEWTRVAVSTVDVDEWMLPKHFERRGTIDPRVLPHYPYRDDSLRIWHAIREWVQSYIGIYYRNDADVQADRELQDWARECVAENGARLRGVGDDGRFVTVDNLVDTVTLIVYQATAHHALTNFPLQKLELYVPALQLAMYQPVPTRASGATFEEWLAYFPPLEISIIQQSLYFIIGTLHYTELGRYPRGWFVDHRVDGPLQAFRERLESIEQEITRENLERPMPYIYLLPTRIPQSTNI